MKWFILGLIVLTLLGCDALKTKEQKRTDMFNASSDKELCFDMGGSEFHFHHYTGTGTCVFKKEE